jgi:ABC-type arginine transport system permease subunit
MEAVKVKLSALWAARMLSGLQGDSTRLHDPEALRQLIAGTTAVRVTNELLVIMSVIFAIPILMSVLSLTLEDNVNRWSNRGTGTFFVLFDLVFLVLLAWPFSYETIWAVMYLVFTTLVAWYAWKWPRTERSVA